VTGIWTGLWDESGQQVRSVRRNQDEGVTAILALETIKGGCGRSWHMVGTLRT
jgi:hypothetical protein